MIKTVTVQNNKDKRWNEVRYALYKLADTESKVKSVEVKNKQKLVPTEIFCSRRYLDC